MTGTNDDMRILVTGSAGFIGFHLARRLLEEGHQVIGVDAFIPYYDPRLKEDRHRLLEAHPRYTGHRIDLAAEPGAILRVVEEAEAEIVVHLAAQAGVRHALEHPESYVAHNIQGSFHLLEALRRRPARHLLLASTSSAYGASRDLPFRETQPAATPLTIYAASKLAMEHMAHSHAHLRGQPTTTFRFFTVYGPWGRPDMAFFKFTEAILDGRPIEVYNHGQMQRDFTYIDDLVEAIRRLIAVVPEAGRPACPEDSVSPAAPYRLVNIGLGQPAPLMAFIDAIERATGREAKRLLRPMQPGDVPATWADTRLLHALTGFRPGTRIDEGVAAFVAWYRDYRRG